MSITTYAELKTAVADWMHRTDLTAKLPDFITLAESRINRQIRFNQQETEAPLTATVDSRYITLPTGFIAPLGLWCTFYEGLRDELVYAAPEQIPVSDQSSEPSYWTIDAGNLAFECPANQAYTYAFRYRGTDNLSDTNTSNWVLLNHPDVYLYATLIEGAAYIRDLELMSTAKSGYDMAIQEVLDKEHRSKAQATLFTELSGRTKSDIFRGE